MRSNGHWVLAKGVSVEATARRAADGDPDTWWCRDELAGRR
jgi:hypothetical protein